MWKYGAGAGLLKRGVGWHFSYLILEITLPFTKLCYVFEEKFFSLPP